MVAVAGVIATVARDRGLGRGRYGRSDRSRGVLPVLRLLGLQGAVERLVHEDGQDPLAVMARQMIAEPAVILVRAVRVAGSEDIGLLVARAIVRRPPETLELRLRQGIGHEHIGARRGGDDGILVPALAGDAHAGDDTPGLAVGLLGELEGDVMVIDGRPVHARVGIVAPDGIAGAAGGVAIEEADVGDRVALVHKIEGYPPKLVGRVAHGDVIGRRGLQHAPLPLVAGRLAVGHEWGIDALRHAVRPYHHALLRLFLIAVLGTEHHEVRHDQLRLVRQLRVVIHVGVEVLHQRVPPRLVLRQEIEGDQEALGGIAPGGVADEVKVAVLVGDRLVPTLEVHGGVAAGDDHDALLRHVLVQLRLRAAAPGADLAAVRAHHPVVGLEPVLARSRLRLRLDREVHLGGDHRLVIVVVLLAAVYIGIASAEDPSHQHVRAIGIVKLVDALLGVVVALVEVAAGIIQQARGGGGEERQEKVGIGVGGIDGGGQVQLHHRLDMDVDMILEAVGGGAVVLEPLLERAGEELRGRQIGRALVDEAEVARRYAELLPHVVHQLPVVDAGALAPPRLGMRGLHEGLGAVDQVEIEERLVGGGEDIAGRVDRLADVVHVARGVGRRGSVQPGLRDEVEGVRRGVGRLGGASPQGDLLEEGLALHPLLEVEHEEAALRPLPYLVVKIGTAQLDVADAVVVHRDGDLALPRTDDKQAAALRPDGEVELRHPLGDVHRRVIVGTSREEGRRHQRQGAEKQRFPFHTCCVYRICKIKDSFVRRPAGAALLDRPHPVVQDLGILRQHLLLQPVAGGMQAPDGDGHLVGDLPVAQVHLDQHAKGLLHRRDTRHPLPEPRQEPRVGRPEGAVKRPVLFPVRIGGEARGKQVLLPQRTLGGVALQQPLQPAETLVDPLVDPPAQPPPHQQPADPAEEKRQHRAHHQNPQVRLFHVVLFLSAPKKTIPILIRRILF